MGNVLRNCGPMNKPKHPAPRCLHRSFLPSPHFSPTIFYQISCRGNTAIPPTPFHRFDAIHPNRREMLLLHGNITSTPPQGKLTFSSTSTRQEPPPSRSGEPPFDLPPACQGSPKRLHHAAHTGSMGQDRPNPPAKTRSPHSAEARIKNTTCITSRPIRRACSTRARFATSAALRSKTPFIVWLWFVW